MRLKQIKMRFTFQVTVVTIFIFASLVTACIAIGLQYYFSQSMAEKNTLKLYDTTARHTSDFIDDNDQNAAQQTALLANFNNLVHRKNIHPDALQLFANAMRQQPLYLSIYIGFENGDLQQLINLHPLHNNREQLKADKSDRWVLVSITNNNGQRQRQYSYFNKHFKLRAQRQETTDYDTRKRDWYQNANELSVYKTDAYLFAQSQVFGQTFSFKVPDTETVLGLDIALSSLSNILAKRSNSELHHHYDELYLYKANGDLLASDQNIQTQEEQKKLAQVPYPELLNILNKKSNFNKLLPMNIAGQDYYIYISQAGQKYSNNSYLAIMVSKKSLFSESNQRITSSILLTISCILLFLPLSWYFSKPITAPINALAIEANKVKERQYDQLTPISSNIVEIQELSNAITNMSSSIESYQSAQKELLDSFIKLIAQAIDEKSPYTAGHCNRVPVLGMMLANAAQDSSLPPFADFAFKNEDECREFKIAAWLHDCGKITTPEYIVDKGSKLEALYNRIHEVRMRFEVLRRDAEIEYYQKLIKSPDQEASLQKQLVKRQQQLTKDFEFIGQANIGGEFFSEQDTQRLVEIGKQKWLRYFDNKLGLSPMEQERLTDQNTTLPVQESLLANKPEHVIKRHSSICYQEKFEIKMDIPKDLYNLGEIYNLSISRGTLTAEDRFKINQHVISTIKLLENLPFPAELARVPRYASTHHETLKGTGYPRKLRAEDLSIPERILVVADIFEALTAADRPYKKAKSISVAIDILYKMALDEHIDMDIFKLFLSSGTYLDYAHKFLDQQQIDHVDTKKYFS